MEFFRFSPIFLRKISFGFSLRIVFLLTALGIVCALSGCGRRDNPQPPGPVKSVTIGLVYPNPAFIKKY